MMDIILYIYINDFLAKKNNDKERRHAKFTKFKCDILTLTQLSKKS